MNDTFKIGGDLEVRRLGFGAMRITGKGIWGPPSDPEAAKKLLHHVIDLGINLIDTADAYGPEVSENLIAEALHPYPKGLVIATKGGLLRGGPNDWSTCGRPDHLKAACEASLKRLKLDRIDLYQLHAIDDHVPLEESLGALRDLQNEGKIRHIGVSNFRVMHLQRAVEVVDVVTVQNRYNLADRKHDEVVDWCTERNIGFIPWYPLATGDLTERSNLPDIAKSHEAAPSQIALAWLLRRSPVMLPIPGTSSIEHLQENTRAREIELTNEEFEALSNG